MFMAGEGGCRVEGFRPFIARSLDLRNLHKESHRGGAWCSVARWEIGICINEESSSGGLFVLDLVEDVLGCIDCPEMGLEANEQTDEATYQERQAIGQWVFSCGAESGCIFNTGPREPYCEEGRGDVA